MGWIASLIGAAAGFLLIPLGFAVGVYVPMVITDTAYQLYNYLGMSAFARQLFGSTNGVGVNWHNGFSQFLLISLIIGVIAFAINMGCIAITNWTKGGAKHQVAFAKIGYGVFAIVLVPIIFMFSTTFCAVIFNALSGNSSQAFITADENGKFQTVIGRYQYTINDILINHTFNLNGDMVNWHDSLTKLIEEIKSIQKTANEQGMTSLVNACEEILNDISNVMEGCSGGVISNLIAKILQTSQSMSIGERIKDLTFLQEGYDGLFNALASYSSLMTHVEHLSKYQEYFSLPADYQIWNHFSEIIGGDRKDATGAITDHVEGWIGYVRYQGKSSGQLENYKYSINNIFMDYSWTDALGKKSYFVSGINQMIAGCEKSLDPEINHYWTVGVSPIINETSWIGIDEFYQRANPLSSFTLTGMINAFIVGQGKINSNYSIWTLYGSAYGSFFTGHMERVVMGMVATNMTMACMMSYAWYIVGRVIELIVLWLGSIIVAFTDNAEGTQFKSIIKATINKTLSLIFVEFVFTITNVLINMGFMQTLLNSGSTMQTGFFNITEGFVILGICIMFYAGYFLGNTLTTMILGEVGQLRSFGDQMQGLSSTARQQYGHGTANVANKIGGVAGSTLQSGAKGYSSYSGFKAQGGSGLKDYGLYKKTGGKMGLPKKD